VLLSGCSRRVIAVLLDEELLFVREIAEVVLDARLVALARLELVIANVCPAFYAAFRSVET
jgi:hypothetical protein